MNEIEQIILKKTNKNKEEENWKTHYREKSYFPSACAFYQFVFFNTNNYVVGFG